MAQIKHHIPKASSAAQETTEVVADLKDQLGDGPFSVLFYFSAGKYDLSEIGKVLSVSYPDIPIIGCTTAGVIDDGGYNQAGICAFGLPEDKFNVAVDLITPVSEIDMVGWRQSARTLVDQLHSRSGDTLAENTFGFLLVDGMSLAEENVLSAIHPELGDIPLFGGSAGDDLKFHETQLFCCGQTVTDGAALILINTSCPFKVFRTQHFVETARKMVITEADPHSRIVKEINASPATEEYARLIGVPHSELTPLTFAKHPVMVRVGGSYYVRSIQRPEGADGLKFFCAIDEGLVLTLAEGRDMTTNLEETMKEIQQEIGVPELIIGCDCIFRKLELEQKGDHRLDEVSEIFKQNNVVGFNTYGEQFSGMHVNQTLTGVAIGWPHD
ncbi:conserved hypothetical protein [Candidatus Terasakiella magnetica]|uniref:FIST domain containing protein n=1 Tax=Candidatus Terasakiella magnetica TaxID=1867952 RepID=A0A1C3RKY1_9PROT|nr:FIST N-terminal domain-containing protein [Candidatus Terasakiella magnetica]SCA57980.1 conserved hypothetical protein [Candidatus Terasakiella magnetica]